VEELDTSGQIISTGQVADFEATVGDKGKVARSVRLVRGARLKGVVRRYSHQRDHGVVTGEDGIAYTAQQKHIIGDRIPPPRGGGKC